MRRLGAVEGVVALPDCVTLVVGVVGLLGVVGFPVGLEPEVQQLSEALQLV